MHKLIERFRFSDFYRVFNWKNEKGVGCSVLLWYTLVMNISNVFIAGVFYTGFLAANGIDIVRVGIIAFIPYIAWALSLFSPMILRKFKKRRGLLLFNAVFYYSCVVLATTVVPSLVDDPGQKTLWFGVFVFLGNASNALLGSGAASWHLKFIPKGSDRNVYLGYMNLVASLVNTGVAVGAGMLVDTLPAAEQAVWITTLRYVAYGLAIAASLFIWLVPKEYPYQLEQRRVRITDVITVPFRYKKFMLTAVIIMLWNAVCNVNSSTWSYYVLNTIGAGYTMLYINAAVYTVGNIFLLPLWRKAIGKYGWFKVLHVVVFLTALWEFPVAFSTSKTIWVFVLVSICGGLSAVGTNLVFANMFYLNLPEENQDECNTFWNFSANISVLIGSSLGTLFLSVMEKVGVQEIFGLPFYGSQFLTWVKGILLMGVFLYIKWVTPRIQPDEPV